jgi:purine-nucleoside phosphorylase
VEAHAGQLALGRLQGRAVAILQGRFHRYEGYSMAQLAFPVRVVRALGARVLVVTNIAGGMHPLWALGDIVVIADHINLMGESPLVGPNDDAIGPRFPDMSAAYDPRLRGLACTAARRRGLPVREGIYVAVTGPNLETAAEYRMLRTLGADVVGMSTVPEVITAVHAGMRVLALSVITDRCLPDALAPVDVPQILAIAQRSGPRLMEIVTDVVTELDG